MSDLARLAGVSRMTVSLALRNHASISAGRRKEIQALAEKHGYVVDPELSSLSQAIRHRSQKEPPILSLLAFYDPNTKGIWEPYVKRFHSVLEQEVEKRGYRLQIFYAHQPGMTPRSLLKILLARGIKGLIMGAHDPNDPFAREFDFGPFSTVCLDVDQASQGLPCAGNNHYQTCFLALTESWKKGYRKPALLIYNNDYLQNWRWRESAYHFFIYQKELKLIPPLILSEWSDLEVSRWLKKHQPDVLLSPLSHTPQLLSGIGFRVPKDFAFCSLHIFDVEGRQIAGIDNQEPSQFGSAVDLVIDQMNRNVRGRQETPVNIFTPGRWVDGATLPEKAGKGRTRKTPAKRGVKKPPRR